MKKIALIAFMMASVGMILDAPRTTVQIVELEGMNFENLND